MLQPATSGQDPAQISPPLTGSSLLAKEVYLASICQVQGRPPDPVLLANHVPATTSGWASMYGCPASAFSALRRPTSAFVQTPYTQLKPPEHAKLQVPACENRANMRLQRT